MISKNDSTVLFVSPEAQTEGIGTFDSPFESINLALAKALPGHTIVLLSGTYHGDCTIQVSGSYDKPIRIIADENAPVIISEGCWYLYDASDLIITGLEFHDSPGGSIAVIGNCERNRFAQLTFKNCAAKGEAAGTMFFGGSGANCNMIEHCVFDRSGVPFTAQQQADNIIVGLIIAEGDTVEGEPIKNHIVRNNTFVNYDYAILAGSDDNNLKSYGHTIAFNTIRNCRKEGIMVKCGDTLVHGNTIEHCTGNGVSVLTGESSVVEQNRITYCGLGIRIAGMGHTVSNNCIIKSQADSIRVLSSYATNKETSNVIIEHNSCMDWAQNKHQEKHYGIALEEKAAVIIQQNLFCGSGDPFAIKDKQGTIIQPLKNSLVFFALNHSTSPIAMESQGFSFGLVDFADPANNDFTNTSGFGAQGWVTSPKPFVPSPEEENALANSCSDDDTEPHAATSRHADLYGHNLLRQEVLEKSFFFDNEDAEEIADNTEVEEMENEEEVEE